MRQHQPGRHPVVPDHRSDRTYPLVGRVGIHVAQVALGFGGGYGKNPKKFLKQEASDGNRDGNGSEGLGGGGGMFARPKGVYEISPQGTKFIPANYTRHLLIAALAGFLIRSILSRKKR